MQSLNQFLAEQRGCPIKSPITVSGGFHNAPERKFRLNKEGEISTAQFKALKKHICGVYSCSCGCRDMKIEDANGSQVFLDEIYPYY